MPTSVVPGRDWRETSTLRQPVACKEHAHRLTLDSYTDLLIEQPMTVPGTARIDG